MFVGGSVLCCIKRNAGRTLVICNCLIVGFIAAAFSQTPLAEAIEINNNPGDQIVFGADSPVYEDGNTQAGQALSGDICFWAESGFIYFKDLSKNDPGRPLFSAAKPYYFESAPAISRDAIYANVHRLAWLESNGGQTHVYYMAIDFDNLQTISGTAVDNGALLSNITDHQTVPSISPDGSKVAWQENSSTFPQTYLYDFSTGQADQAWGNSAHKQTQPSADNEWVVWTESWDLNFLSQPTKSGIYAKRTDTEEPPVVIAETNSGPGDLVGYASAGRNNYGEAVVVYAAALGCGQTGTACKDEIRMYNLSTGAQITLPAKAQDVHSFPMKSPRIDGDKIVWQIDAGQNYVQLYDLSTNVCRNVSQNPTTYDLYPRVSASSRYVVWSASYNSSPKEIYFNRIGDTAQQMADKYAPELHFRHDIGRSDRNDFEPRTVNLMVDGAEVLATSNGEINKPSLHDLIDNPGSDSYLDLPGSPADPFQSYADDYKNQLAGGDYPVTTYARVIPRAEGTDNTVIQYWFNYYYNNWYNNHEGDWEMVEVILNGTLEPAEAAYAQHGWPWKKGWNEGGVRKTGTHPKVFVAEGSHASYFLESADLHFLEPGTPNAFADETGSASSVIPSVNMNGLTSSWADYAGHWGQARPTLCWWCQDGPQGPAFQPRDPWNQPLTWANSSYWKGLANDVIISAASPVDINLYDQRGRHVGKDPDGSIDMQITGSEFFERDDDHSRNIVIHNADILSNLTLKVQGTGIGTMDLTVQVPDFGGNAVDNPQYHDVNTGPSMQAELDLTPARDFDLKVDSNGDGIVDELRAPDSNSQQAVDFTPPSPVTDLAVRNTSSGSVALSWTAPGDDGSRGTAFEYDLRYSTRPITEDNWQYATSAGSLPDPQPAESAETVTVSGLDAAATYYFAIEARDDAWQASSISNIAIATTTVPDLNWSFRRTYWASFGDYQNHQLSVDFSLGNNGTGIAISPAIAASLCNPSGVNTMTPLPLTAADLETDSADIVTLKFYVPMSVGSFKTTTYANCRDDAGRTYWFPGPMP